MSETERLQALIDALNCCRAAESIEDARYILTDAIIADDAGAFFANQPTEPVYLATDEDGDAALGIQPDACRSLDDVIEELRAYAPPSAE